MVTIENVIPEDKKSPNEDFLLELSETYNVSYQFVKNLADTLFYHKADLQDFLNIYFSNKYSKKSKQEIVETHKICKHLLVQSDEIYNILINCDFIFNDKTKSFEFFDPINNIWYNKNGQILT